MNLYDTDIHTIVVQGAVAATFPFRTDLDTGVVMPAAAQTMANANRLWQRSDIGPTPDVFGPYFPRLLKIQSLDATPVAGSVSFVDIASTVFPGLVFGFAADAAKSSFDFWPGGIWLPRGGFGVTITGAGLYMICFTWSEAG